ncbi:gamma-glutamyltransferase [Ramlibacter sp. USB13]|uniref:Glutathione hydrolase proenzyme n=1 Tax=Ramlibacter cellulosilyticus TaxID=2764187 RepID=A0A923S9L1_9BURK|nr:gamma-glutamyltransferase [Ramlibacter cellulosilyticus]MBC5781333.1 gamma-glutamyltransferase [Ramlibacter cellulosilyticus]
MRRMDWMRPAPAWLLLLSLAGCGGGGNDGLIKIPDLLADTTCTVATTDGSVVVGSGLPGDPAAPEAASGYRTGMQPVYARSFMVVTNTPLASKAGCDVLKAGGSAADAAVAVQAVLGLVEPQSSGLGGGAFMLYYDAKARTVVSYDGRETAPAAATENYLRWIDDASNQTTPRPSARASGRSIGTPGVLRMLELAHNEHGKLPWKDLFQPGIQLASGGFRIPGRMADAIASNRANLQRDAEAAATYYNPDGTPRALGSVLTIPAYANTLTTIANNGAGAFYTGAIAQAIVAKVGVTASADGATAITPGKTTLADLANYQAKKRKAVCTTYRAYWVCGMGPPSSGGIAVAQSLGILENFNLSQYAPTAMDGEGGKPTVTGVHLVSEAERLAYADRDKYVADTDFVSLPGGTWNTMLNKPYLAQRASLISMTRSMGTAQPGDLGPVPLGVVPSPENGTTHVTIVDRDGNVVSMTTTVESSFGSFHMTNGFILNNQLTDFAATPTDGSGTPVANRVQAGKRPRSSMAPTIVFRKAEDGGMGDFAMATGSPGGSTIIQYVVKTLVGVLDWGMTAQQATSMVDFGAANSPTTNVGGEHPNVNATASGASDPLVTGLRSLGHTVSVSAQSSGLGTVRRTPMRGFNALEGGVDPRREGLVLGDTFTP